jgi:uncharacterized protein (DUF305 family)
VPGVVDGDAPDRAVTAYLADRHHATGAPRGFDTAFMEMMIKHHEDAVAMAKTEKTDGALPEAKKMADAIITSQTAEITRMNDLPGKSRPTPAVGVSSAGAGPRTPLLVTLHR